MSLFHTEVAMERGHIEKEMIVRKWVRDKDDVNLVLRVRKIHNHNWVRADGKKAF